MALSRMAASVTVRAIGPAVSNVRFLGAMPSRLTSPVVGRRPTMPLNAAGLRTEVLVSVPTAATARLAATATAEPLLEPPAPRRRL